MKPPRFKNGSLKCLGNAYNTWKSLGYLKVYKGLTYDDTNKKTLNIPDSHFVLSHASLWSTPTTHQVFIE